MNINTDLVIVGGGVVGTAIAYFAALRGMSCTLLEKGVVGSGASNAASGVLSSYPGQDDYARLGRRSLELFHELAPSLREESRVDIELEECGELILALDESEVIALQGLRRQLSELGADARWIESDDLLQMEPALNPAVMGAIYEPDVCRVNNQRLSDALASAARRRGAVVRQGVEVTGLLMDGGRVTGVNTSEGPTYAGNVVLAAGAWTGLMDRWLYGDKSPSVVRQPMVKPVRGVNLNLQPRHGSISSVIHGSWGLLVPRNDGSVIAGATVEEVGFDSRLTVGSVHSILGLGAALVPSLGDADFNWGLAGLRPGSADSMPVIGPLPDHDNVYLASGHFRNGILLCLATGEAIAGMLDGNPDDHLASFSPARFL